MSDDGGTDFGDSGVGTALGPGQFNWDITAIKRFKITEAQTVQFRAEFYNAFNHPQFANPSTTLGPTFAYITATSVNPRIIQFGLKYTCLAMSEVHSGAGDCGTGSRLCVCNTASYAEDQESGAPDSCNGCGLLGHKETI